MHGSGGCQRQPAARHAAASTRKDHRRSRLGLSPPPPPPSPRPLPPRSTRHAHAPRLFPVTPARVHALRHPPQPQATPPPPWPAAQCARSPRPAPGARTYLLGDALVGLEVHGEARVVLLHDHARRLLGGLGANATLGSKGGRSSTKGQPGRARAARLQRLTGRSAHPAAPEALARRIHGGMDATGRGATPRRGAQQRPRAALGQRTSRPDVQGTACFAQQRRASRRPARLAPPTATSSPPPPSPTTTRLATRAPHTRRPTLRPARPARPSQAPRPPHAPAPRASPPAQRSAPCRPLLTNERTMAARGGWRWACARRGAARLLHLPARRGS